MIEQKNPQSFAKPLSLYEQFIENLRDLSPEAKVKAVLPRLEDLVRELGKEAIKPGMSETGKDLWTYDAAVVLQAHELLHQMVTEQWRQREAIKLYLAGQIDRGSLRSISNTWDGDRRDSV